jgi:hypothetical protein
MLLFFYFHVLLFELKFKHGFAIICLGFEVPHKSFYFHRFPIMIILNFQVFLQIFKFVIFFLWIAILTFDVDVMFYRFIRKWIMY